MSNGVFERFLPPWRLLFSLMCIWYPFLLATSLWDHWRKIPWLQKASNESSPRSSVRMEKVTAAYWEGLRMWSTTPYPSTVGDGHSHPAVTELGSGCSRRQTSPWVCDRGGCRELRGRDSAGSYSYGKKCRVTRRAQYGVPYGDQSWRCGRGGRSKMRGLGKNSISVWESGWGRRYLRISGIVYHKIERKPELE